MDEANDLIVYYEFKTLSERILSGRALLLLEAALCVIRNRYPNSPRSTGMQQGIAYPSPEDQSLLNEPWPCVKSTWTEYTTRMSQSTPPAEGDEFTPSMWRLVRDNHLDTIIVDAYLNLLRKTSLCEEVAKVRPLESTINIISEDGRDRPTIIPFYDVENWAFVIAYPDCIHWYDSNPNNPTPQFSVEDSRPVVTTPSGPKLLRPEDSGVLMLISIRVLLQKEAHLSQKMTDQLVKTFRTRMVVELLSGAIDRESHFEEILRRDAASNPCSFFDEALWTEGSPFLSSGSELTHQTAPTSLDSESDDPASQGQDSDSAPTNTDSDPTPRRRQMRIESDDRKIILTSLSDAVIAKRSATYFGEIGLQSLWFLLQRGRRKNTFPWRYHAVRFYEAKEQLGSESFIFSSMRFRIKEKTKGMEWLQDEGEFWKELCELLIDWGEDKYIILCVVPSHVNVKRMSADEKKGFIEGFQSRLVDNSDLLRSYLTLALPLYRCLAYNNLPGPSLMIESYNRRRKMKENTYREHLNVDPSEN